MNNQKRTVLVTGTGGCSVGAGILHSLTRSDGTVAARWRVIAADADPFAWGLYQTSDSILLPKTSEARYMDALKAAIKKYDVQAVIPGTEVETVLLSGQTEELTPVKVICNKQELMPLMIDKKKVAEKLQELGIPFIPSFALKEVSTAIDRHGFPLILKPVTGTGGSKGVRLVMNEEELNNVLFLITDKDNYCIQPYVGNPKEEYTVGVLTGKTGVLIDSIVMKRQLTGLSLLESRVLDGQQYAISTGSSQGYIIRHPEIQDFCEQLALRLGSTGPLNIQLRKQGSDILVFEIHPRFSGTTPIRADVGFNEVDVLLRIALDDVTFGRLNCQYNVAAIRALEHVIVPIDQMKHTRIST